MTTLVVRIAAPLMAWGDQSKYRSRLTRPDPTYSAIQGLLAAAAGVPRGAKRPQWVQGAQFAVRVDAPGRVLRDYHTINPPDTARYNWLSGRDRKKIRTVVKADGNTHKDTVQTERFYREDAAYTLFITDPSGEVEAALTDPKFTLFAGRKSCVLSFPLILDRIDSDLETAAERYPRQRPGDGSLDVVLFTRPVRLSVIREEDVYDTPVGADFASRRRFYAQAKPPSPVVAK
jgi:CRISPR system Cascade subunit CasD